jgi:hypothetical protein
MNEQPIHLSIGNDLFGLCFLKASRAGALHFCPSLDITLQFEAPTPFDADQLANSTGRGDTSG